MDKNTDWESCLENLSELPPKLQYAIIWLINNLEVAVKMCEASCLTGTERDKLMKRAIDSDDSVLKILLILDKVLKQNSQQ